DQPDDLQDVQGYPGTRQWRPGHLGHVHQADRHREDLDEADEHSRCDAGQATQSKHATSGHVGPPIGWRSGPRFRLRLHAYSRHPSGPVYFPRLVWSMTLYDVVGATRVLFRRDRAADTVAVIRHGLLTSDLSQRFKPSSISLLTAPGFLATSPPRVTAWGRAPARRVTRLTREPG